MCGGGSDIAYCMVAFTVLRKAVDFEALST